MTERRKSRRFNLDVPMELRSQFSTPETCATKNVSSSGVLFHSLANLDPGEPIEFLITLPTSVLDMELHLRCRGKVVRRTSADEIAASLERWEFIRTPVAHSEDSSL